MVFFCTYVYQCLAQFWHSNPRIVSWEAVLSNWKDRHSDSRHNCYNQNIWLCYQLEKIKINTYMHIAVVMEWDSNPTTYIFKFRFLTMHLYYYPYAQFILYNFIKVAICCFKVDLVYHTTTFRFWCFENSILETLFFVVKTEFNA